jgi:hypothetical protein
MVSFAKKKSDIVNMLGSGALEALQLAIPLAKTIPLVGGTVEGSLQVVLYIIQVKDVRLHDVPKECSDPSLGRQDEEGAMPTPGRPCRNDHSCHHH